MKAFQKFLAAFFNLAPCLALIAGCAGGGGSSAPVTSPQTATISPPAPPTPTYCSGCVGPVSNGYNYDTGIPAGPIAAPLPPSFGFGPAQLALPGGPSFDGLNGNFPVNVVFPLISTSLKSGASGLSASANTDATLTVISSSGNSQNIQLSIPSLNLTLNSNYGESLILNIDGFTSGFSYVVMGSWDERPTKGALQSSTQFAFGYETPRASLPQTGIASFYGPAYGSVFKQQNGTIIEAQVGGSANLQADFSSGQVKGALVSMQQGSGLNTQPNIPLKWNDVSFNASIAQGSSRFSGTTAATSAPGTGFSLAGSATGNINGAFYGPGGQNVGAVWTLNDGSISALGTLMGK